MDRKHPTFQELEDDSENFRDVEMDMPLLDYRDSEDLYKQAIVLAKEFCPEWIAQEKEENYFDEDDPGLVLIKLFSKLSEYLVNQLNKIPYKYLLAFFDFVGMDLQAAQPARVALTFHLAENALNASGTEAKIIASVPARTTRVAVQDNPEIVFETLEDLDVIDMGLESAYSINPWRDSYTNHSKYLGNVEENEEAEESKKGFQVFGGDSEEIPIPHKIYIDLGGFIEKGSFEETVEEGNVQIKFEGENLFKDYFWIPLFEIDQRNHSDLDILYILESKNEKSLEELFSFYNYPIPKEATIQKNAKEDNHWEIKLEKIVYTIFKKNQSFNVCYFPVEKKSGNTTGTAINLNLSNDYLQKKVVDNQESLWLILSPKPGIQITEYCSKVLINETTRKKLNDFATKEEEKKAIEQLSNRVKNTDEYLASTTGDSSLKIFLDLVYANKNSLKIDVKENNFFEGEEQHFLLKRVQQEWKIYQKIGLPKIKNISSSTIAVSNIFPDLVFANDAEVDALKGFYPFGEEPKEGNALYIASKKMFSKENALLTLKFKVKLIQTVGEFPNINLKEMREKLIESTKLSWEYWNGYEWNMLELDGVCFTPLFLISQEQNSLEEIKDFLNGGNFPYILRNEINKSEKVFFSNNLSVKKSNEKNKWEVIDIDDLLHYTIEIIENSLALSTIKIIGNDFTLYLVKDYEIDISFYCPRDIKEVEINGAKNKWIRTRINEGRYGRDGRFSVGELKDDRRKELEESIPELNKKIFDALKKEGLFNKIEYKYPYFEVPFINNISIDYSYNDNVQKDFLQKKMKIYNNFKFENFVPNSFPYKPASENPTFFLGFKKNISNKPINLFFSVKDRFSLEESYNKFLAYGDEVKTTNPLSSVLLWKYYESKEKKWKRFPFEVQDETSFFHNSNIVRFIAPPEMKPSILFGKQCYWIKIEPKIDESQNILLPSIKLRDDAQTKQCINSLNTGTKDFSDILKKTNNEISFSLSNDVSVSVIKKDKEWLVVDKIKEAGYVFYIVKATNNIFNIFKKRHIKIDLTKGNFISCSHLENIYPNTIKAINSITVENEILGSGSGSSNLSFHFSRKPVLEGAVVEIKEKMPSKEELEVLRTEEGEDVVSTSKTESGKDEVWVRWHRVESFVESTSISRHYTLDFLTGKVTFGDGVRGVIPSDGKNNIAAKAYKSGGGIRGNVAKNTITNLKVAIPSIETVTNYESASGGSEQEELKRMVKRAPFSIKNRERAITQEDFEWLAAKASPEVIKAKCLVDTDEEDEILKIKIVVLVRSSEIPPKAKVEQRSIVQDYLKNRVLFTFAEKIEVVNPSFKRINVSFNFGVDFDFRSKVSKIQEKIEERLMLYFDPLNGGKEWRGWNFGEVIQASEVFAIAIEIEGVSTIDNIRFNSDEQPKKIFKDHFPMNNDSLPYSGEIQANFVPDVSFDV